MSYTCPRLTVQQEDDILKDLNYSRQQLENDKMLLRTWLNEQEHFPESRKRENDTFFVSFLVGCKGSLEKAKKKLDAYYSIRGHGEMFTERDTLDCVKSVDNFLCYAVMPKPTSDGNIVTVTGLLESDPKKCTLMEAFKMAVLCDEWRLREGSGISRGDIFIVDTKGCSVDHLFQINPSLVKSISSWILAARPSRLSKFLIINTETFVNTFANSVARPLLTKKLRKLLIITSDSDISKHLKHLDNLPSTYGGKELDMVSLTRQFSRALISGVQNILPTLGEMTDESKRPKTNGFADNPHFGAFGSIKTLITD